MSDTQAAAVPPSSSRLRKRVGIAAAGVVVLVAGYVAYESYTFVTTDDAMVGAQATLLSSKVSGIIIRADVEENQPVKAGQILAEIRPDDYQSVVEQLQSDADSLAAQLKGAQATYQRTLSLYHKGASTQERVDTAEAEFHSLEGKLKSAQAHVAGAKLNLEYTRISAPADGKVGRKSFEAGMLAAAGQPLMGFVAGKDRWVVANLKETDMEGVTTGRKASVSVDAIPGRGFDGVVESISPATGATFSLLPPDNATGNFTKVVQRVPIRIKLLDLADADIDRLQAGLSAEVKIPDPLKMNGRAVAIIFTAAIASLLEIIDSSIVNVAIPTMMGNLGATLDEISWVTTGYMIANSIVLPIAAWLGSRLGRRKYFTTAILLFTAASFACGVAPNLGFLIFFRVLQGLAGGALLPTSQTLIQEQFPPEKAGMAMAIFGLSVMIGPALGPTLGGYLTDSFGWRSIFNVNIPLGLLAATMSWLNVTDTSYGDKENAKSRVDWTGLLLLCVGVGCFQYILERGEADGWWDAKAIRACAVFAVTGLSSFVWWELRIPNPIMNLRLFKNNVVRSGTMLMLMLGVMVYSLTFVVPVFVSRVIHQMDATQIGMLFIPGSLVTAAFMLPIGLALKKVNPKLMVLIGIVLGEASVYSMSRLTTLSGAHDIYVPLIFRGMATAFLFIPINQMVLGSFRGPELGQVAGMQNFFRQIGGSIGISSLDTLITRFSAQHYNDIMAHVNALNPSAYYGAMQNQALPAAKMSNQVGLWNTVTLSTQALAGRAGQQVFILSFQQLCWVIMGIVGIAIVPLLLIKPAPVGARPVMDAH